MIKRLIAIFTVLSVCISVYADLADEEWLLGDPNKTHSTQIHESTNDEKKAIYILDKLGLIVEEDYNLSSYFTRGAFLDFLYDIRDKKKISISSVSSQFADVSTNHRYFNAIEYANKEGIAKGELGGNFRPDDIIDYNSAICFLVRMLGYEVEAEAQGGYPLGYTIVAKRLNLTDEIADFKENVSVGSAMIMALNALSADYYRLTSVSNYSVEYKANVTFGEYFHDIVKTSGFLNKNEYTSIYNSVGAGNGKIEIDEQRYSLYNSEYNDFIGQNVNYYYKKSDGDIDEILYMEPSGKDEITVIYSDMISEIDGRYIKWTPENSKKTRTLHIPNSCMVLLNGVAYENYNVLKDFDVKCGSIKFIENDKGCVALIEDYKDIVVGKINKADKLLSDKFTDKNTLLLDADEYEYMTVCDVSGNEITIDDIKINDVISYIMSKNRKYLKCIVTTDTVTGVLTSISSGADMVEFNIEGINYNLSYDYAKSGKLPSIAERITLYINIFGEIAGAERLNDVLKSGYLIKAVKNSSLDASTKAKILTEDNKVETYILSKKCKIDGKKYSTDDALPGSLANCGVVLYKINEKNEILSIDTTEVNENNYTETNLEIFAPKRSRAYMSSYKSFAADFYVSDETVIFTCPMPSAVTTYDDKYYTAEKGIDFNTAEAAYTVEAFTTMPESSIVDLVVIYKDTTSNSIDKTSNCLGVISSVSKALNSDGEVRDRLEICTMAAGQVSYDVDEDFDVSVVEVGDIVRFNVDFKDEISYLEIQYNLSEDKFTPSLGIETESYSPGTPTNVSMGYVHTRNNGIIGIVPFDSDLDTIKYNEAKYIYSGFGDVYKVYEGSKGFEVEKISVDQICDYKDFCVRAKAFCYVRYGYPNLTVIYE